MRRLLLLTALLVGCGGSSSSPRLLPCERNSTAMLTIRNGQAFTIDVSIDGITEGSIGPGQQLTRTVTAGSHLVGFTFTNSGGRLACNPAVPSLVPCANDLFCCGPC